MSFEISAVDRDESIDGQHRRGTSGEEYRWYNRL